MDETKESTKTMLEIWQNTLEYRSFKLSKLKPEYIGYKFSKNISVMDVMVNLEDQFRYLGTIIQNDGRIYLRKYMGCL